MIARNTILFIQLFIIFSCQWAFSQKIISDQGKSIYLNIGEDPSDIKLTWLDPSPFSEKVERSDIQVKIGLKSTFEIASIRFFVNGKPYGIDRGFELVESDDRDQFDQYIEKRILFENGTNKVTVTITDKKGYELTDSKSWTFRSPVLDRRDFALLFATDEYDQWNNLVNPINDAETIKEELEINYGYQVELVKNGSREQVMRKLKEYAEKSYLEKDQLFIYFAGHGQFDDSFGEGYLVCKDSWKNDPGKVSVIPHSSIRTVINNIPSKHILLVMDVCFGGTFDPVLAKSGYRGEEYGGQLNREEFIMKKLEYKTRKYLTSGGKEYVPDGIPGHHSPFTRRFLEGLRSYGGHNGVLTIAEVFSYMEDLVPEPRTGEFGENEPGSDYVFIVR